MAFDDDLLSSIRDRFHHVDRCPVQGPRAFFENAGGSLTLKAAVERTAELMAMPDNLGRANPASAALGAIVETARADMFTFFGATSGRVFIGETGTALLNRLIRSAILASPGSEVVGSALEHPATFSASRRRSEVASKTYHQVGFDTTSSVVVADHYAPVLSERTGVATIIHASPVTGMHVDIAAIASQIRERSPECFIIVDGIQHAAHGRIDIDTYGIDGYVISGYKAFSRHNFGVAWVSERLAHVPHDNLIDSPADVWEMGTRDVSAYAAFSEVVRYLEWLGTQTGESADASSRAKLEAAARAIASQEHHLVDAMLWGTGSHDGLAQMPGVSVIGPASSEHRSGMVSFEVDAMSAFDVVEALNAAGVRTHARKRDYYSSSVLVPLGIDSCIRASAAHYNSIAEVDKLLAVVADLAG
ncbi:MAG: aminotransferase class V-fold PLP-dependent enzyme [Acidimicrobiales bacterium]